MTLAPAVEPGGALSPDLRAQIRRIEIRSRRLAASLLGGDYRSVFRGTGIEFAEAREYAPGDDVRRIDWNVTARMGTPWVKEYVEERELSVLCAVDVSASQSVGRDRTRLALAAEVTALLSFAAAYHNDRAGLLTFSEGPLHFVPPARGTRHVLRMVRDVLEHEPAPPRTDIAAACDYLARVLRRRSVVFLVTDGLDHGFESALRTLARRHEVIALTLVGPNDLDLPDVGLLEVEDAESGGRLRLDTSRADVRRAFARAAAQRASERRAAFTAAGVEELELHTDQDHVPILARYFRRRAARR